MGAPQHVLFNIFVHVVVTTRKKERPSFPRTPFYVDV